MEKTLFMINIPFNINIILILPYSKPRIKKMWFCYRHYAFKFFLSLWSWSLWYFFQKEFWLPPLPPNTSSFKIFLFICLSVSKPFKFWTSSADLLFNLNHICHSAFLNWFKFKWKDIPSFKRVLRAEYW